MIPSLCNCQNLVCKQANLRQTESSLKLEYGKELGKHWTFTELSEGERGTGATGGEGEFSSQSSNKGVLLSSSPHCGSGLQNHLWALLRPELTKENEHSFIFLNGLYTILYLFFNTSLQRYLMNRILSISKSRRMFQNSYINEQATWDEKTRYIVKKQSHLVMKFSFSL